jgi:hypothetical protein
MYTYMTIKSTPKSFISTWWNCWIDNPCHFDIYFVDSKGVSHLQGEITSDLGPHDLEHLMWGLGFTFEEEVATGALRPYFKSYDLKVGFEVIKFTKKHKVFDIKLSNINGKLVAEYN